MDVVLALRNASGAAAKPLGDFLVALSRSVCFSPSLSQSCLLLWRLLALCFPVGVTNPFWLMPSSWVSPYFEPHSFHSIFLVINGIACCHLVNFTFCCYLCYRYGKKYNEPALNQGEKQQKVERNAYERTCNLIKYDFFVCFYVIFIAFEIAWTILGHIWLAETDEECQIDSEYLIIFLQVALALMWVYLSLGLLILLFSLCLVCCDSPDCQDDFCRFLCLCLTLGCCDIGKKKINPAPETRNYQRQKSKERQSWIGKGQKLLR
jgi:hypothetical protein